MNIEYLMIGMMAFLLIIVLMFFVTQTVIRMQIDLDMLIEEYAGFDNKINKMKEDLRMINIIPTMEDYIEAYENEGISVLINDGKVTGVVKER